MDLSLMAQLASSCLEDKYSEHREEGNSLLFNRIALCLGSSRISLALTCLHITSTPCEHLLNGCFESGIVDLQGI